MAAPMEELEKRLANVEQEVSRLQQRLDRNVSEETPAVGVERLLREAKANQAVISAAVAKAFAEMGITGEPIGAEKVQELIAACGIKPEDNEFSREIIAMREE